MKYQCGHEGCDVCGARTCAGTTLKRFQYAGGVIYLVCDTCVRKAIVLAVQVSAEFSTYIDPSRPCGDKERHP